MASSIWEEVVARGIQYRNHESDLYIPVTQVTREMVKRHNVDAKQFYNDAEHCYWFDIAFAYLPYWQQRYGK